MSLLDVTMYDLSKPADQFQALQDIIDEHNNQYDESNAVSALNVVAAGVARISLPSPPWSGPPIPFFTHTLGYAPVFLAYFGTIQSGGILSAPFVEYNAQFNALAGDVEFSADSTNLYVEWNDHAQSVGQSITYIVFARPIAT